MATSHREFYNTYTNDDTCIALFVERGIVQQHVSCLECDKPMKLGKRKQKTKYQYFWRCRPCNKTRGFWVNSLFEGINLSPLQLLDLIYLWTRGERPVQAAASSGLHRHTTARIFELIRDSIVEAIDFDDTEWQTKIGGPGKIVEIDEAKFGKRKYHQGARRKGIWVLGGYERGSNPPKAFLIPVEARSKEVLQPLIVKNVVLGSTIITDQWDGYNDLQRTGYTHLTVSHSRHFKDSVTGARTNSVEGYWAHTRRFMPSLKKDHEVYGNFLIEFMFRKRNKDNLLDAVLDALKI